MIERAIDYLQFSALLSEHEIVEKGFQHVPAPKFYRRGYIDGTGFRYFYGNPNSKLALIVASGNALHNARISGKSDEFILNWALAGDGKITRLDLAVTDWVDETLVTIEDIETWFKEGRIESYLASGGGKLISALNQDLENTPETLYIGDIKKRGKKGIFRAYDKGIELNIGKYLATRLEVEIRGESAHNTARRIAMNDDISGNFRAKLNIRHQEFDRLMDAPVADVTRGKAKDTDTEEDKMAKRWTWIIETVAPSLREAAEFDKKRWNSDDRMYWFLRDAGFTHEKIVALLDLKDFQPDNKS